MPSPDFQVIQWIKRIRTRLNPEWKEEYKSLLILSVLELLNNQPDHPNKFEYTELFNFFKTLIPERASNQVLERQFSNPYIRLRSDQEPLQVWIPQPSESVDIETINPANPASVRRGVPYIKINDEVWSSFQSQSVRDTIREEINERLSPSDTQGSLFDQIENIQGTDTSAEIEVSDSLEDAYLTPNVSEQGAINSLGDTVSVSFAEQEVNSGQILHQPAYSLEDCANATYLTEEKLGQWIKVIKRKKQAILYGPPGTGKTFIAEHLVRHIIGEIGFYDIVQFHPAYSYEDFIQGIRPVSTKSGTLTYPYKNGRFLDFCEKAKKYQGICVLILDEMNRANLAQVFGELMYLLEYRDKKIPLASGKLFEIPQNVIVVGTMNTADRSIALIDYALRRRFAFIALQPDYDVLRRFYAGKELPFSIEKLIETLGSLNREIDDPNYEIGSSFFLCDDLSENIEVIWKTEIEPYLEEYFFTQRQRLEQFGWGAIMSQIGL
jgi:DNA polymerase III delta prime subunit